MRAGVAERDELGVQALADAGQHLKAEVLLALLDAGDGALAGAERLGELRSGSALVLAGVTDQGADAGQVVLGHGDDSRSHVR